jgi:hypothetical protein
VEDGVLVDLVVVVEVVVVVLHTGLQIVMVTPDGLWEMDLISSSGSTPAGCRWPLWSGLVSSELPFRLPFATSFNVAPCSMPMTATLQDQV